MRIGIDCRPIFDTRAGFIAGIGYYTQNLTQGMIDLHPEDEFVLFFEKNSGHTEIFKRGQVQEKVIGAKFLRPNSTVHYLTLSEYKKFLPLFYSQVLVGGFVSAEKLDVFHGTANVMPLGYRGATVVTVHDLAIYRHPEWFPGGQAFATKVAVPQSLRKSAKIIAVSSQTKQDLTEILNIPEKKIVVVPNGVDLSKFYPVEDKDAFFSEIAAKYKIPGPYILNLNTIEPRKNIIGLLEAYWRMGQRNPELADQYHLVIAGKKGWLYDAIFQEVENRNLRDKVIFTGYVPDEDVPKLMRAARCLAFPSFYEGFGLPLLEAMACGIPAVASEIPSLTDLGGTVPYYVAPHDTEGISFALEEVISSEDEQKRQKEQGPLQAQKFSWGHTIEATHKVYEQVV